MLNQIFLFGLIAISSLTKVNSECPNACNGHGQCTSYDMCICNKDWQGNDCSERTCPFGRAHVDTPLGDLNGDGVISNTKVVLNNIVYPYGVAEKFPLMQTTDLSELTETAHDYMECSNKGTCDRTSGDCSCYEGYEGNSCQRTVCPNSCSGHGVCKSKAQLAGADYGNTYNLWDANVAQGCQCDPGYMGADCSLKVCKYAADPLYLDDSATIKFSEFNFALLTTSNTIDFTDNYRAEKGYWAIRFFDHKGEDWLTPAIRSDAGCYSVVAALESLPNNVIPKGSVLCYKTEKTNKPQQVGFDWQTMKQPYGNDTLPNAYDAQNNDRRYYVQYNLSIWDAVTIGSGEGDLSPNSVNYTMPGSYSGLDGPDGGNKETLSGFIFRLLFTIPGALREPEIEIYLDGEQPSLVSKGKLITKVWTDGSQGEDNDYFADHCDNVFATIGKSGLVTFLNDLTSAEKSLLKKCLADADFDYLNNIEVFNWDYGNALHPHFIKLVRTVASSLDGSSYAALYYDPNSNLNTDDNGEAGDFILVNPVHTPDFYATDLFEIYTTSGTLALVSNTSSIAVSFGSQYFYSTNYSFDAPGSSVEFPYDGDLSCESSKLTGGHCLNKDDLFTVLNWEKQNLNPPFLNIYSAKNLFTQKFQWSNRSNSDYDQLHFMTHVIKADLSSNWGISNQFGGAVAKFRVYKFFNNITSTYNYVNECANRGLCARDTGLCGCFPGYTSDDCSIQDVLSV